MADKAKFIEELSARYTTKGDFITLGKGMLDGEVVTEVNVTIPLKTINRHGLIAGATGTGKTKTLQVFAEQLSHQGIPSLVLDIKGDFFWNCRTRSSKYYHYRKIFPNPTSL